MPRQDYILCERIIDGTVCGEYRKIKHGGGRTKYCLPCAIELNRIAARNYQKKRDKTRYVQIKKSKNLCTRCGRHPKASGNRFLCSVCFKNYGGETVYDTNDKALRDARAHSGI